MKNNLGIIFYEMGLSIYPHWTLNFMSFEMAYSMSKMDSGISQNLSSKSKYMLPPNFEF